MEWRTVKNRLLGGALGLIALSLLLFAVYTYAALHWVYSSGNRAGYVQKFSKKGWLCKTWEGELAMTPVPGAIPEKFLFSVRDEEVAKQLTQGLGKRVMLGYEQHKGVPSACFGESEYYVVQAKVVE